MYGVDRLLALWDTSTPPNTTRSGSTPRDRLGPLRPRGAPAVRRATRSCAHDAWQVERREPRGPAAAAGAVARPPSRRLRSREHADRVECRRVVRVARHTPSGRRRPAALRRPHARGGTDAARLDRRDRATSSATSTAATRTRRSTSSTSTRSRCSATSSSRSRSPPRSGGCVSTARSVTDAAHHRCARLRRRAAAAAVRRRGVRVARDRADGRYAGELTDVPPTGEARAQVLFDYADAEGLSLASRSRTPTRRPTSRCSKPSGSRSR